DHVAHQARRRGGQSRTKEAAADLEPAASERREELVRPGNPHALEAPCREGVERPQESPGHPLEVVAAARPPKPAHLVERTLPLGDEVDGAEVEDGVEASAGKRRAGRVRQDERGARITAAGEPEHARVEVETDHLAQAEAVAKHAEGRAAPAADLE